MAHDAHNVVVAGTNDADILRVIQELERLQGGQVAVVNGRVKAALRPARRWTRVRSAAREGDEAH